MTKASPDPSRPGGLSGACPHRWLLIMCGECGARIDTLGRDPAASSGQAGGTSALTKGASADDSQALFIVARGHPELVAQLKAVMGDEGPVLVIEDRRRATRNPSAPEAAAGRTELRRKVLRDHPDQKR